jgi:hypothetical protein
VEEQSNNGAGLATADSVGFYALARIADEGTVKKSGQPGDVVAR